MMKISQGMLKQIMDDIATALTTGKVAAYSGNPPAHSGLAETGVKLWSYTVGLVWGTPTFDADTGYITLPLSVATPVTANCIADGTIGYVRVYDTAMTLGISTTAIRYDLSVSSSGLVTVSTTKAVSGNPMTIDSLSIKMPDYRR